VSAVGLTVHGLSRRYGDGLVLNGIDLTVTAGKITALLGPSGGGKSTLLRIIAGLEQADGGEVRLDGNVIDQVPAHRRGFGMVFQDYALFPHLNVRDNIEFGLRMQSLAAAARRRRSDELLELVGLTALADRSIAALSGGERQRVALARALAPQPRLLMLDEPLAALDRELRERLQEELAQILRNVGITALYVTHDQREACMLADQIALLNAGRVAQFGRPAELFTRPASLWVCQFLGMTNQLAGTVTAADAVETALGRLPTTHAGGLPPGTAVTLVIPPDAAQVADDGFALRVLRRNSLGRLERLELGGSDGTLLRVELPAGLPDQLRLRFAAEQLFVFARDGSGSAEQREIAALPVQGGLHGGTAA
jgi:ABC-type Fe3+/spermidine/putrescine transport system ATPase subunit